MRDGDSPALCRYRLRGALMTCLYWQIAVLLLLLLDAVVVCWAWDSRKDKE